MAEVQRELKQTFDKDLLQTRDEDRKGLGHQVQVTVQPIQKGSQNQM